MATCGCPPTSWCRRPPLTTFQVHTQACASDVPAVLSCMSSSASCNGFLMMIAGSLMLQGALCWLKQSSHTRISKTPALLCSACHRPVPGGHGHQHIRLLGDAKVWACHIFLERQPQVGHFRSFRSTQQGPTEKCEEGAFARMNQVDCSKSDKQIHLYEEQHMHKVDHCLSRSQTVLCQPQFVYFCSGFFDEDLETFVEVRHASCILSLVPRFVA